MSIGRDEETKIQIKVLKERVYALYHGHNVTSANSIMDIILCLVDLFEFLFPELKEKEGGSE